MRLHRVGQGVDLLHVGFQLATVEATAQLGELYVDVAERERGPSGSSAAA